MKGGAAISDLKELIAFWKRGGGPYSREYLPLAIFSALGSARKLVAEPANRENYPEAIAELEEAIREAEELVARDKSVLKEALKAMEPAAILREIEELDDACNEYRKLDLYISNRANIVMFPLDFVEVHRALVRQLP